MRQPCSSHKELADTLRNVASSAIAVATLPFLPNVTEPQSECQTISSPFNNVVSSSSAREESTRLECKVELRGGAGSNVIGVVDFIQDLVAIDLSNEFEQMEEG